MPGPGKPFSKGKSGNPGGRSKKRKDIEALAQQALESTDGNKAIQGLLDIAQDDEIITDEETGKVIKGTAAKDRKAAWELLMAYAYGKPRQRVEHSGGDGEAGPLGLVVEFVKPDEKGTKG